MFFFDLALNFFSSKLSKLVFIACRDADFIWKKRFKKEHLPQWLSSWFRWLRKSELSCYLSVDNRMGQSLLQHQPNDFKREKTHIKKCRIITKMRTNVLVQYQYITENTYRLSSLIPSSGSIGVYVSSAIASNVISTRTGRSSLWSSTSNSDIVFSS